VRAQRLLEFAFAAHSFSLWQSRRGGLHVRCVGGTVSLQTTTDKPLTLKNCFHGR
jgi:hypothetical protein